MNTFNSKLKARIMKRVYRSWFLRSVAPLFAAEIFGGIVAIYFFANIIFVGAVLDNALKAALGNPFTLVSYLWGAFLRTRNEVQVIILALFLAFGMMLRDINRSIISYFLVRRDQTSGK